MTNQKADGFSDMHAWASQGELLLLMRRVTLTLRMMMAVCLHHAGLCRTRQPAAQSPLKGQSALRKQKPRQPFGSLLLLSQSMRLQLFKLPQALKSLPAQKDLKHMLLGPRQPVLCSQMQAATAVTLLRTSLLTSVCLATWRWSRRATWMHKQLSPGLVT